MALAEMCYFAGESVEDEVPCAVCGDEETLSVVCEFDFCPVAFFSAVEETLLELLHVPGCEGRLVVVSYVV